MSKNPITAQTEFRKKIPRSQKAWKYIRDVTNTEIGNLNKTAIEDGSRKYTYGLMFREWERYASVFSALGMTGENHARVGLLGSTSAQVVFAVYGLNMVGADVSLVPAYSALFTNKITETIRSENLTDFIVTDDFAQANLINDLLVQQRELGLKHVIVLHVPVAGVTVHPVATLVQEAKFRCLKGLYGPIYMDELLKAYGNRAVAYAAEDSGDTAFILHTSGTTSGAGKPVALSDEAFNAAAAGFYETEKLGLDLPWENLSTAVIVDLSNAYSIIDQVHLPFAMGASVALAPGGVLNPWFHKAIPHYRIAFLFAISAMFERWMKMPEDKCPDFSSLRYVVLGGTAVSAADKHRFYEFLREHGAGEVTLLNGYGISELGGACCLSSPDLDDESIGRPLPGVKVRLLHEESGVYFGPEDAPCEGVLYLNSPSLAAPELDGRKIVNYEYIEGEPYICTNDYARMEEDGKLTFLGRANRYFINEEGRKYESGRVETEIARQSGIESCCVVPVYIKTTHDNIPMLCVKTLERGDAPADVIRSAFRQVFVSEKTLQPESIPCRVMIADELPRNANGKIDLYKISRGEVEGETFTVETVKLLDKITDFRLVPYEEGPADMIKEVFDGISAEMKGNLPGNKSKTDNTNKKESEEEEMKKAKKAVEAWNSLNRMGLQMMQNLVSRMGQPNPDKSGESAWFSGMPEVQKAVDKMKAMNQKTPEKVPGKNALAGAQGVAQDLAKSVVPAMQDQVKQMMDGMEQMNRIAQSTMQGMIDRNAQMMNEVLETVKKIGEPAAKAEEPAAPAKAKKPAAAKAEKPAAAAKAEKPAAAKAKKPAAAAKTEKPAAAKAKKPAAPKKETKAGAPAKKAPPKAKKPAKAAAAEEAKAEVKEEATKA